MSEVRRRYLYVIASGKNGPCKVGTTQHPRKRIAALQTASPYKLRLCEVWYCDGGIGPNAEDMAHASLCDCRLSGEWFDCAPQKAIERINMYFYYTFLFEGTEGVEAVKSDVNFGVLHNGWATAADLRVLP